MFSNWSLRWISRAIVTPSLVTSGVPVIFSRMTLRPLGPRVDLTASASWSTPALSRSRASCPNFSSLATAALLTTTVSRSCAGRLSGEATGPGVHAGLRGPPARGLLLGDLGREHVADELGRFLEVAEHDGPVVHVDHLAVVRGHVLLELRRVVEAGLLAEGLGDVVVDEVHPADAVDADHRRQVGDGDVVLAVHDLGNDDPDLVVHQRHACLAGRGVVSLVGAFGRLEGPGHLISSSGVWSPRSDTIPAKRLLARSRESSKRGGLASGWLQSGCSARAASRHSGTQSESHPCISCLLWSANSLSDVSGPKHA